MNYRYYPMLYNKKIDDFECLRTDCVLEINADHLIRVELNKRYGKNWSRVGQFYYGDSGHVLAKIETVDLVWR